MSGSPRVRRARSLLAACAAAIACLAAVACGDDDSADTSPSSGQAGAYPVSVPGKFGTARITEAPKRVVALDYQSTDAALALGIVPVGMGEVTYVEGGVHEWTKAALRGKPQPKLINADTGIPIETVAALRPDVILANHAQALDKDAYDRLRRIAPVVHFSTDSISDTWQQTASKVGSALGRADRAARLVAAAEGGLRQVRERTPALKGKTVNFFVVDASELFAINQPTDQSIRFLSELGMRLDPDIAGQAEGATPEGGRTQLSPERYELLDSDVLLGTSFSPEGLAKLEDQTLFKRLGAVRERRYVPVGLADSTSIGFPSLLSVPFATREVVPRIERAAR